MPTPHYNTPAALLLLLLAVLVAVIAAYSARRTGAPPPVFTAHHTNHDLLNKRVLDPLAPVTASPPAKHTTMGQEESRVSQATADAESFARVPRPTLPTPAPNTSSPLASKSFTLLCGGDSITYGSPFPGYRGPLLSSLRALGATVGMLGAFGAPPADDAHTAVPGANVAAIVDFVLDSVRKERPRVLLLHAGTNDLGELGGLPEAAEAVGRLLDRAAEAVQGLVVVVAEVGPVAFREDAVRAYNERLRRVVMERRDKGARVMSAWVGEKIEGEDTADLVHPNEKGYAKMAKVWVKALEACALEGWL